MDACLDYLRENGAEPAPGDRPTHGGDRPLDHLQVQFGCENFGKNHCCPPEAPDYTRTRAVLDSFSTGILFRVHHWNATAMAAEGARRLFLDGYYKALAFGSGPCKLCPSCAPEGCRFPGKAVPAMEACGIDVFGHRPRPRPGGAHAPGVGGGTEPFRPDSGGIGPETP